MTSDIKRMAVVPARGGSKRIPGKNMIEVCGKSIIDYILLSAIHSNLFQTIIVSSDSSIILNHAGSFEGIKPKLRPDFLANDDAGIYSVMKYEYESEITESRNFDEVWLLSATACLISSDELIKISQSSFESIRDGYSVLGVTEYSAPIQWAMNIDESGLLKSLDFESSTRRSQDLSNRFHDAGCFAIFPPRVFSEFVNGIPDGFFKPYILSRDIAIDVDTPIDLEIVRAIMASKLKSD